VTATQVIVLAKAPVAGRVKTRLCPPCTPVQAAAVAAAALADTLDVVTGSGAGRRILAVDGVYAAPGWVVMPQRGPDLGARLAHAFADADRPGTATLLIGMDTPQLSVRDLDEAFRRLAVPGGSGAVLGPAADGGWWALGLRDNRHASVLAGIATSTASTGADTRSALRRRGLRVDPLRTLTDVDSAADARAVAALCPAGSRFRAAVAAHVPDAGPPPETGPPLETVPPLETGPPLETESRLVTGPPREASPPREARPVPPVAEVVR
jgi:rSAM/selenodomain-associated transferase 1